MHQPTNTIRSLRALVPQRRLSYREAEIIAERQANKLRDLLELSEQAALPDGTIEALPRIVVKHRHSLPVSGLTHWHNGRWLIVLNADEPDTRRRFSLAHELAHAMWHHARDRMFWDESWRSGDQKAEYLADYFAGCLLMPKRHVKSRWGIHRDIHVLADQFNVSAKAMSVRLSQLGLLEPTRRCMRPKATWQHFGARYFRDSQPTHELAEVTS